MVRSLFLLVLAFGFLSTPAWAGKFKSIESLKNKKLEAYAAKTQELQKNKMAFGTCSNTRRYSFTRKEDEENLNTVKQLNYAKGGVWKVDGESTGAVDENLAIDSITETLIEHTNRDEYESEVDEAEGELNNLLRAATNNRHDKSLELFDSGHANEDGTWNILDVLDTKNNEVLLVSFGFCGT